MSRYRKIEVKMWDDERFRQLSPMPPSGQALWIWLLTGTMTSPIPGLFRAGTAAMAEALGWSVEDFAKSLNEVAALGMVKTDSKARLVWIPNAIYYNRPASINVVKSWRGVLQSLPKCALRDEAVAALRDECMRLGDAFVRAFLHAEGEQEAGEQDGFDEVPA